MEDGFEPITTKEEFQRQVDAIVKGRLERAEKGFRERYAEVFEKARAYDEAADAAKTELQRATERADAAEAQVRELEGQRQAREWADDASARTGVPASLIHGSTKEEMLESAEAAREWADSLAPKAPVVPSEGRRPSGQPGRTPAEMFAAILNGE